MFGCTLAAIILTGATIIAVGEANLAASLKLDPDKRCDHNWWSFGEGEIVCTGCGAHLSKSLDRTHY